jgi:hypothetical protein
LSSISKYPNALPKHSQCPEILCRLGCNIFKQFNDNFSSLFATNFNFQKDPWIVVIGRIFPVKLGPLWGCATTERNENDARLLETIMKDFIFRSQQSFTQTHSSPRMLAIMKMMGMPMRNF